MFASNLQCSALVVADAEGAEGTEAQSNMSDVQPTNNISVEGVLQTTGEARVPNSGSQAKPKKDVPVVKTKGSLPVEALHDVRVQVVHLRRG